MLWAGGRGKGYPGGGDWVSIQLGSDYLLVMGTGFIGGDHENSEARVLCYIWDDLIFLNNLYVLIPVEYVYSSYITKFYTCNILRIKCVHILRGLVKIKYWKIQVISHINMKLSMSKHVLFIASSPVATIFLGGNPWTYFDIIYHPQYSLKDQLNLHAALQLRYVLTRIVHIEQRNENETRYWRKILERGDKMWWTRYLHIPSGSLWAMVIEMKWFIW